ncbi:DNA damage-regulated autophagy modulator protein 1-like [Limulus polyphemus]|uniref:DNA damage-regulated autophagy modulator protein 1-like n=1 Tax=Limulus polyphemus TaxID=6850 RepID=A0ABM1SE56_LIMPO|nr:DNA damage-regulated autophagy modulator protein 1-like [Limulus polyphemus]
MTIRGSKRIGWIPLSLALLLLLGVIVVYIWAVIREDVRAWIPYISEAGGYPPESGVFGIFLFLGALLGLLTMTLRYFIVIEMTQRNNKIIKILNILGLFNGLISIVGMVTVATYPVGFNSDDDNKSEWKKHILLPHTIGAFMLFIVGVIYTLLQTIVTYLMYPRHHGLTLFYVRLACGVLALVSLITMMSAVPVENQTWVDDTNKNGTENGEQTTGKRVSIAAEWLLAFFFISYFFTFYREFQKISLSLEVEIHHFDQPSSLQNLST